MEGIRNLFLSVNLYIMPYQEYKINTKFHDQDMVLKCCLVGPIEKPLSLMTDVLKKTIP